MAAYRPFKCSICLGDYKDPKILSCFHSFCLECLRDCFDEKNSAEIKCPLCRQLTPMPEDGIQGLSNNIYVEPIQGNSVLGKLYCGFCCSNFVAEFRCRDCNDLLCLKCKEQHMQMKQTKGHILEVVEEEQTPRQDGIEMCPLHITKEVLFGCYNCKTECCSKCWDTKHSSHKIGPLTEVASAMREEVGEYITGAKVMLVDLFEEQSEILVQKDQLGTFIGHTNTKIDRIVGHLKNRIDNVSMKMKNELRETEDALNQKLQNDFERNEANSQSVSTLIESTTASLENSSNINILKSGGDLKKSLIQANSQPTVGGRLVPHLVIPNIDEAILSSLRDHSDIPACNILHPTLESKVLHSIKVKTKKLMSITCLANDYSILLGDDNRNQLHQLSLNGEHLGACRTPFRVDSVVQLRDGSIAISKFNGRRVAKFWLEGNYVNNISVDGFTHGLALAHDENDIILCCNDTEEDRTKGTVNSRLVIMDQALHIQRLLMVPSGREVVRRACQNRNGDFVAITSKRCFVLSRLGVLKLIYKFNGIVHSVCTDKHGNIIILHEERSTKMASMYDANLVFVKCLFTFPHTYAENKTASMTLGRNGCLWISLYDKVGCVKYIV